jgi:hypothetical protein
MERQEVGQAGALIVVPDVSAHAQAGFIIQIPIYGTVFYDTFSRTTTAPPFAVGVSDSGHQWYWSNYDSSYTEETTPIYVDGSVLAFPTPGTSEYDTLALHGVGTLDFGEVRFDFWVGAELDSVSQQLIWCDSSWSFGIVDGDIEYRLSAGGSEGSSYWPVTRSAWHTVRVVVDSSNIDGEYVKGHIWKIGTAEPETWSVLQVEWPVSNSSMDVPLLDIYYSSSSETTKVDNIYIQGTTYTVYNQVFAQALVLLNQSWGFGQAGAYIQAFDVQQYGQADVYILGIDLSIFGQSQALILPRTGLLAGIGYPIPYYYNEGPYLPDLWYSETGPNQPNYGEDRGYPPGWSTNDNWSMRWYGRFVADETGEWSFASSTDDGSRVDVYTESSGELIGTVDNNLWGGQGETWREGTIYLTEGQSYFLIARAIQGAGGWRFRFWYKKPSYGDWEYLTDNSAPWIDLGIKRKIAQAEVYTVYINPETGAIIDFRVGQAQAYIIAFDQNALGQALVGITREPYDATPNFGLYLNQGNETYSVITEPGWPNFPSPAMPNNYEWWAKGTFVADVTGDWEFQLLADYRAIVSINAVSILDVYYNNGTVSTTVALEAGTRYTLDLYWYGDGAINGLQAWYKRPGEWVWNYLTDANPPWTPLYSNLMVYSQAQASIVAFDVSAWGQAEVLLNTGFGLANTRVCITKPLLFYDTFSRTTSAPPFAVGVSDSGHQWYWSDYDTDYSEETSVLYADGSALAMPTPGGSTWDSLALRGTGTTVLGEVQFDFWVGAVLDSTPQDIRWIDANWHVALKDNGSDYRLRGNNTDYWPVTRSAWHTVRLLIDENDPEGHYVKGHIWKVGDDEPDYWSTLLDIWPDTSGAAEDYPILDIYQSSASETTQIDNIYIRGTSTRNAFSQALVSIKRTYPRPYTGTLQGSLIVRPIFDVDKTGYIYYTSGSTGWNLVDEVVLNTDDWYGCRYEGTPSYISHQFSETNLTIDVIIDSVVFTANITAPAPTFGHDFQERNPDTGSRYTLFSLGQGDVGDYSSSELTVRPWDSESWTLRDINQLQFGAATNYPHSFQGLQVRQIYATITWHYPTEGPFGLALTTVKTTYKALGQSRVQIGHWQFGFACAYIYQPLIFAQAQTSIQTFDNVAVAQAAVYMHEYPSAQAQAQIKQEYFQVANAISLLNTGFGLGQVQADILATYYSSGQARPWIKQTVQSNAQAQTIVRIRYKTFAQARVVIVTQRNSIGQAMVYIGFHQFSQAQARIIAFGVPKFGLARGYIAVGQLPIEPSSDYQTYLVRFNNYDLPGYAQSESYDSVMNISTHPAPYMDGSLSEYTGLANKTISLKMLLWEKTYLDCKNKLKLAATIFRMSKGFSPLYIQHYDKHYLAIAKSMQSSKSVPESVRILGYDIEFEAKPWLISNMSYSVSGTGTVETTGRTLSDGGWTPTIITVSGTDVEIAGITTDGQSTGVIELTGTVSNLVIDTEAFTALQGTTNMGGIINKDFSMYVGSGVTTFSITGATSCTIVWGNRWYL